MHEADTISISLYRLWKLFPLCQSVYANDQPKHQFKKISVKWLKVESARDSLARNVHDWLAMKVTPSLQLVMYRTWHIYDVRVCGRENEHSVPLVNAALLGSRNETPSQQSQSNNRVKSRLKRVTCSRESNSNSLQTCVQFFSLRLDRSWNRLFSRNHIWITQWKVEFGIVIKGHVNSLVGEWIDKT